MSKDSHINILWTAGADLAPLLRALEAFASRHNLLLMPPGGRKPLVPPWGAKPYTVHCYRNKESERFETDEPAALEPPKDSDFWAIYWELYTQEGHRWFSLYIVQDPDRPEKSVNAGRVHRLNIGVDEFFAMVFTMRNEEFKAAKEKYHQFRELLTALDADAVEGRDGATGALVFRFAKDGPQMAIPEEFMTRDSDWEFVGEAASLRSFRVGGLDVEKHYWKDTRVRALVKDPHSDQELTFEVSEIRHGERVVRFATGKLSNGMWGFYVRK